MALLATVVIWSAAFAVIKLVLHQLDGLQLTALRLALIGIAYAPVLLWMGHRRCAILPRHRWRFLVVALFVGVGYHLPLNIGETMVGASTAALIIGLNPILTWLVAGLLLGQHPTLRGWVGMVVAFLGVATIILLASDGVDLQTSILGGLVVLIGPLAWAISAVLARDLFPHYGTLQVAASTQVLGSVLAAPLLLWLIPEPLPHLTSSTIWGLVFLGLISSAVANLLWFVGLQRLGHHRAAVFIYLIPVAAVIWSLLLLGETLTIPFLIGGILTLGGMWLVLGGGRDHDTGGGGPWSISQ